MTEFVLLSLNGSKYEIKRSKTNSKKWLQDSKDLLGSENVDIVSVATDYYVIHNCLKASKRDELGYNTTISRLNKNANLFFGDVIFLYRKSEEYFLSLGDESDTLKRIIYREMMLRNEVISNRSILKKSKSKP